MPSSSPSSYPLSLRPSQSPSFQPTSPAYSLWSIELVQTLDNIFNCSIVETDFTSKLVFSSAVTAVLATFKNSSIVINVASVLCILPLNSSATPTLFDRPNAHHSGAKLQQTLQSSESSPPQSANFSYTLLFSDSSSNSTVVQLLADSILLTLNSSVPDPFTSYLQQFALSFGVTNLQYVRASRKAYVGRTVKIVTRSAPPSSQPVQVTAQVALSTGALAGIVVAGVVVLILIAVLVILYILRTARYVKPGVRKSAIPEFGAEYPDEAIAGSNTAVTNETRTMLQKIQRQRRGDNARHNQEVFESDAVGAVFVNKDRALYTEKINTKLFAQLADLTVPETSLLLSAISMPTFVSIFAEYGINGRVLVEIESAEDIDACGVKMPRPVAKAFVRQLDDFRAKGVPRTMLK